MPVKQTVVLRTLAGSRAYNLHTEDSDHDYHEVAVVPTADMLRTGAVKPDKLLHWDESDDNDCQRWEIGHFLRLALRCNPTILETFAAPITVGGDTRVGLEMRGLLPHVLSQKAVRKAFLGYATNQRAKLFKKPDDPTLAKLGDRALKFAQQYLRVLMTGERLLRTGELVIDMQKINCAGFLKGIKEGDYTLGYLIDRAVDWECEFFRAYDKRMLPEEPDVAAVDDFLLKVRREYW